MMIFILIILAIFVFYAFVVLKKPMARWIFGFIGIILLMGAVGLTTLNFHQHWGMKQVTTTETKQIYSAGPATSPVKLVLTKQIGTKANNYVMMYRDHEDDKEATAHFVPNKKKMNTFIHSTAKYQVKDTQNATVTLKETRWRWNSDLAKLLFDFAGMDGSLQKKEAIVTVPKNGWQVMTPEEAQAAAKKMALMQQQQATLAQAQN
ncbi:DUF4811 domain-containing protein [Weissella coleopterorum]|uniref:DUF4811 domain-containing protein n=1 Tax=Weissella coleopterorum TaxID=2714949 RepID=A0A6G8AZH1_9LACO|nr:DUF4811 domain-containing protein [Weissella coleopterorum]QIL50380.1 DUF4811 domain-containing protein [Weissella coleopterorum]